MVLPWENLSHSSSLQVALIALALDSLALPDRVDLKILVAVVAFVLVPPVLVHKEICANEKARDKLVIHVIGVMVFLVRLCSLTQMHD